MECMYTRTYTRTYTRSGVYRIARTFLDWTFRHVEWQEPKPGRQAGKGRGGRASEEQGIG